MNDVKFADYEWLITDQASELLGELADQSATPTIVARLRRRHSPSQVHLLLEQVELRRRARAKFSRAAQLFFTRTLLEQATDERIAAYKAARFPADSSHLIADLCCGIGGDTMSLATRAPTIAVDRDPIATLLTAANTRIATGHEPAIHTTEFTSNDSLTIDSQTSNSSAHDALNGARFYHIDPDRRAFGSRTTTLEYYSPDLDTMRAIVDRVAGAAIKLAPATTTPDDWRSRAELEWIGRGGECRQQVAWFGELARHPGRSAATIVDAAGNEASGVRTIVGGECSAVPPEISPPLAFLYEPHAAVLAAGLEHQLAEQHELAGVAAGVAYFTSDERISDPALATFEVFDVLPLDERRLRAYLKNHRIGRLEIKKRGLEVVPEKLRARLRPTGDRAATLILFRDTAGAKAIIARRPD